MSEDYVRKLTGEELAEIYRFRDCPTFLQRLLPRQDQKAMPDPLVICCQGPPRCDLEGDEAIAAQEAECPWCKRIVVHADGTETVYEPGTA